MADVRSAEEIFASVRDLIETKKCRSPRELVEELRLLSVFGAGPRLVDPISHALQLLKTNKKAGEENKTIRAMYQVLSSLAVQDDLPSSQLFPLLTQLSSMDVKDELLPRRLAALQLFADLAVRNPKLEGLLCCNVTVSGLTQLSS
jgi:hypothetical protein